MRRGERAGAPTGAVGVAWPSSRASGAGEQGDAAGSAVDRRRGARFVEGVVWRRAVGGRRAARIGRSGRRRVGLRRLAQGSKAELAGGHRRGGHVGVAGRAAGAISGGGSALGAEASRLRAEAVSRKWRLSRAHHCVMGSRVNLRFSAGRPRVCRDPGRAKRPESAVPWS